ncbi:redox-sensitive transcriptional regulator HypR [Staphylococcus lutrae]|uniref:Transcriptional regulator n=1 Tax=Staphylococcus lutrae TaxID=155085 RepID=A0AAC9RU05_9STAP|nr:redox-sensitive transcriptional regulator HypR [Staphylococcus lutrae]ARJ50772.1 transcriptional regulator [Staphylococcus lutrae]PNZ36129.1 Rrf2 family transcriptional regulator [Staphylococcus lutrae]
MNLEFNIAVHVLAFLNQHDGEVFSSHALAENVCVNPVQLRRVMSKLQQKSYVAVRRGKNGGYLATETGPQIQLVDLFHMFSRPEKHGRLFTGYTGSHCEISQKIEKVMYRHYLNEQERIAAYYQQLTIGDIMHQIKEVAD